jgi:DNA-binding HxlR family transcriptional regulator
MSDRLLSERMKELEARGVVMRTVEAGPPVRVHYELTAMGRSLQPALTELRDWARQWLDAAGAPERRHAHERTPGRRPAHDRAPAR